MKVTEKVIVQVTEKVTKKVPKRVETGGWRKTLVSAFFKGITFEFFVQLEYWPSMKAE